MSWSRRLLQPAHRPTKVKSGHSPSVHHALPSMPTVKFDPSTVNKSVKANLRKNIELLDDLGKEHFREVYKVALRSVLAGRDLNMLATALTTVEGMSKRRAAEIARSLHNKASAQINRERQASLGITHAIWMYSNAPCVRNPRHPTDAEIQEDSAHRTANGKRYEISKGLFVDGKWRWPGVEEGCKCSSKSVMPWTGG